jgi:hypothetical protein
MPLSTFSTGLRRWARTDGFNIRPQRAIEGLRPRKTAVRHHRRPRNGTFGDTVMYSNPAPQTAV